MHVSYYSDYFFTSGDLNVAHNSHRDEEHSHDHRGHWDHQGHHSSGDADQSYLRDHHNHRRACYCRDHHNLHGHGLRPCLHDHHSRHGHHNLHGHGLRPCLHDHHSRQDHDCHHGSHRDCCA